MGDMRLQDLLVSWQALKMTLAVIPGICLVVWAGSVGWSGKRASLRDMWTIWRETDKAKHEGLKEFARTFVPVFPLLAYLLLLVILYIIPADTLLLLVINLCAMPAAVMSYREGRRVRDWRRGSADYRQFDLPWPAILRVLGLWLVVTVVVLIVLRAFGLWHPA